MITSLIDFSFIRSLVADCYSTKGPPCYDPPSLFLLDLFRYMDGFPDMHRFCQILHDQDRGRCYRQRAGIAIKNIPCEATFSNFRDRLGPARYNEIFHALVHIFHQLEMITFNILSHDGTLYPSWARYKGLPCEILRSRSPSGAISQGEPCEILRSRSPSGAISQGEPCEMQLRCLPSGISQGKLTFAINAPLSQSKMS